MGSIVALGLARRLDPRSICLSDSEQPSFHVAGMVLPDGARYPPGQAAYWASQPVGEIDGLASRLAAGFRDSGVWPLRWCGDEDPDSYMYGSGDLAAIDRVNVAGVLSERCDALGSYAAATDPFN